MTGEKGTPTRQFLELDVARRSGESAGDVGGNLRSHLLDRRMTLNKKVTKINPIFDLQTTQ